MKLSQQAVLNKVNEMYRAAASGNAETYLRFTESHQRKATIVLPLGELMNERIAGYVWAWKMQNKIVIKSEMPAGLNAQGLEGCCSVDTDEIGAYLVACELPVYRYVVELV
jgi:hypothetical protein